MELLVFSHVRRLPDLHESTYPNGKVLPARTELNVVDPRLEIEMVQHDTRYKVDQDCSAVIVYRYHQRVLLI
jgi:hypothetical protein